MHLKKIFIYAFLVLIIFTSTNYETLLAEEAFVDNFKLENGVAYIIDEPAYKFKWINWSYITSTNPFVMSYNEKAEGMIILSRIPVGQTLPFIEKPIVKNMTTDSIEKLMVENLENRGVELIVGITEKNVSDQNAILIIYSFQHKSNNRMAVECGFLYENHFFYLHCSANNGTPWQKTYAAFMTILGTLEILK